MRKVLNILESCSLAYKDIKLDKIYEVTGRPSPSEINEIFEQLLKNQFNQSFKFILDLKYMRSLSVDEIIRQIHLRIMESGDLNDYQKMFLVERLSQIEYRLA